MNKRNAKSLIERAKIDALDKSQAVIEFQPDGRIITANQNFLNVMGYELDELVGQHHKIFMPHEEARSREYKISGLVWQLATFSQVNIVV